MPQYIYYKACFNSDKITKAYCINENDAVYFVSLPFGVTLEVPKYLVVDETEGKMLWLEQRIDELEKELRVHVNKHWWSK